ncbi:hypothetical protein [Candidatus Parabeggiatoa sp. HSG14]|uniref:hypothetical protein n=1 Tax=Candidatus Parabeggiatoa sp. HSG14 TaxID=3055593 RepID=UPI0025A858A8|nr:hypothetical protein [Thiotrichales bacterium HSG14]
MEITLNGINYSVYKPKLILEVNSCPKLELHFGHGDYPSVDDQIELTSTNAEATLSWAGCELKIQVVGFEYGTVPTKIPNKNAPYLVMTGLFLPEKLQKWFKQSPQSTLIYQKNELIDSEKGDEFFANKLLNGKIQLRDGEREILKNKLFPPNSIATFLRPPQQDNFSFLCHLIDFINSKEPTIIGWTAFQLEDAPPLRLVSLSNHKLLKLDKNWKPRGQFSTNRYAGQSWTSGNFELIRNFSSNNPLDLLPDLITIGKQDTTDIDIQNKEQLVLIPGLVHFHNRAYFCRTITYQFPEQAKDSDFKDSDFSVILTLTEPHQPPKASPLYWQLVDCQFQGWEESTGEQIKLKLENAAIANSEGEPDSEKSLYAQVLSPTASSIYLKYQKDEKMRCLLIPGELPIVLGSVQSYNEDFEKQADLVIHTEHIALSGEQMTIEAKKQVSIKGNEVVKIGNKVEVGSD